MEGLALVRTTNIIVIRILAKPCTRVCRAKTGPAYLWLPQLVPPSPGRTTNRLGLGLGLKSRAILISTYKSCIDTGWTIYGSGPSMV